MRTNRILLLLVLPLQAFAAKPIHITSDSHLPWLLLASLLVIFMAIPGVMVFYAGLVRQKNVLSVIAQCLLIAAVMSLLWVAFGYHVTFGTNDFFLNNLRVISSHTLYDKEVHELMFAVYQMGFAIITPMLIIGGFPERTRFLSIIVFLIVWEIVVYYPICYWVWGGGFLDRLGLLDFAGGTAVHINAGVAGLVGALFVGNRRDFGKKIKGHNTVMTTMGAAIIWFGWFGFNAGAASNPFEAMRIILVTYIAASAGLLSWGLTEWLLTRKLSVLGLIFGAISGLVAITPACAFVGYIGAIIIGLLTGVFCYYLSNVKYKLKYDDSLDAFGVHGAGGILGSILTGVFALPILGGYGYSVDNTVLQQLGVQLLGVLVTLLWSGGMSFIIFKCIDRVKKVRIESSMEKKGLDLSFHGEEGYDLISEKTIRTFKKKIKDIKKK